MTPYDEGWLTRAHRHFLGLTAPGRRPEDDPPTAEVELSPGCRPFVLEHLATAGMPRGGALLGRRSRSSLLVAQVLPSGPAGLRIAHDPLRVSAEFLLGALEATRQFHGPVDWVGHWFMAVDGEEMDEVTELLVWQRARRLHLVSSSTVLLFIGRGTERPVLRAYTVREGEPEVVEVRWGSAMEGDEG